MDSTTSPTPARLPSAPLVEAIFELRWKLKPSPNGVLTDPGYRYLLGRFQGRVADAFPAIVDLPAAQAPEDMLPHSVRQQFRAKPEAWPLTQIGPGILTLNDTREYEWRTFLPLAMKCVTAVYDCYPPSLGTISPERILLRYLNVIPFSTGKQPPLDFLSNALHTKIALDAHAASVGKQPGGFFLQVAYPLAASDGRLENTFSTGLQDGSPSIIWDNSVVVDGDRTPQSASEIEHWLVGANAAATEWFSALARGSLYASFHGS